MRKRSLIPVDSVSNIELFYDLIFVFCISVTTSMCHHVHGDFLDLHTWGSFIFVYLVILQIWFFTTLLLNRYGDRSASENICLFINMFLLYSLANAISTDVAEGSFFTFHISWALILLNLVIHWASKLVRYDNLTKDDELIIRWNIATLCIQLTLLLVAELMPKDVQVNVTWVALAVGAITWFQPATSDCKPSRFSHIAERCALLVIIAFGEMIVAVSSYMTTSVPLHFSIFVFALVVGLFLIYIFEHDNMLDHHRKTSGIAFININIWVIVILGNLTVALEYMPDDDIARIPKSIMLCACLVTYLLTSFLLGRYNKPEFRYPRSYIVGRIIICLVIVGVAVATNYDPWTNLVCDTAAVYAALLHEYALYRKRSDKVEQARIDR